jgi:hypothetical protein
MKFSCRGGRAQLAATIFLLLGLNACALVEPSDYQSEERLRETARLVAAVKEFGQTLGIESTDALSQTTRNGPALSMLWLWLQRSGTLAVRGPFDVRMAVGLSSVKEPAKIEQVYRVDGYSVYYRQGNEFADDRSVSTVGFAAQDSVRRVKVILHEDLHGDNNFALPWEMEEAIVTPLGALAAVEFFRHNAEEENFKRARVALEEERKLSRELNKLINETERIFNRQTLQEAKQEILALIRSYPTYARWFQRQIAGQHPATVLEAKLSHDFAYFRYFDAVAALSEKAPNLKTLIEDLKKLSPNATREILEKRLQDLNANYSYDMDARSIQR